MAEEYGFEFELVQYKWPRWLNQQTEKQRVIWAWVYQTSHSIRDIFLTNEKFHADDLFE